MGGDGLVEVGAFDFFGDVLVVDPAVAVGGDFVAGVQHGFDGLGVALQGHGDAEAGERVIVAGEQAEEAPEAGAAAVFVEAFHVHVARAGDGLRVGDVG